VWISRNSEDIQEDGRDLLDNLTLASSFNSTTIEHTFGQVSEDFLSEIHL